MTELRDQIVAHVARYERVVEVGVGKRHDVATGLAEQGVAVTATDVVARAVPDGVRFVRDDVTDPDPAVYADADAIYSLNCPPELHRPIWRLARDHGAAFLFTTLGGDPPSIPADPETLADGTTVFRAPTDGPGP